jgi:2'-5' RNA ligase
MIRLFVSLKIPDEVLDRVLDEVHNAAENQFKFKWETKDRIHLTLKFIGEVEEKLVEPILSELQFVENYSLFKCSITRFGFFFRNHEAKILWSDLESQGSFTPIVDELNNRMEKFGIESEKRKFKAHLTLLRIKMEVTEKFIQRIKSYEFQKINFTANKIALVQSQLSKEGARYKDLKTYELK